MRLGMLTPSSNTVLEPLTAAMLADLPGASAHFSGFGAIAYLGAAVRCVDAADARVDAICWNGPARRCARLAVVRRRLGAAQVRVRGLT